MAPELKPPRQPELSPDPGTEAAVTALQCACAKLKPRRLLVLSAKPECFSDVVMTDVGRCFLAADAGQAVTPGCRAIRTRLDALPFLTEVFDLVVAHGLVSDGDERLVGELRRVVKPGGHLMVLGRGRYGFASQRRRPLGQQRVRPYRLCQRLRQRSFVVESRSGAGVMGFPLNTGSGWRQLLYGISDDISVLARFSPVRPVVRRVRFPRPAAAGARVQAMEAALERRLRIGGRGA